jgi:hypothetical protein
MPGILYGKMKSRKHAGHFVTTLQEELGYIASDLKKAGFESDAIRSVLEQQYRMLDKLGVPYQRIQY